MRPERLLLRTALLLCAAALPAVAEERWLLEGLFDAEYWNTDAGSRLLERNEGDPAPLARLHLWTAVELHPAVRFVTVVEAEGGDAAPADELELEQAFLRFRLVRKGALRLDLGRFPAGLGDFSDRYLSTSNPLIGDPDAYSVTYPEGLQLSGAAHRTDFRVGLINLPLVNERYLPEADRAWRPALSVGVSPIVGLRVGLYATRGPYLGEAVEPFLPAGDRWRQFEQRVVGMDLSFSRGYFELHGDVAASSYEVPTHPQTYDGLVWYVEPKYTWSPRWFTVLRYEVNDYVFVMPDLPTWTASTVLFRDLELGAGYRAGVGSTLKMSYRVDRWHVEGFLATILPDGHAFALQFSQRFDVRGWLRRPQ